MVLFQIARPLARVTSALKELADGHLQVEVQGLERADEVGTLAKALQVFKQQSLAEHKRAEDTVQVVAAIGSGLEALAKGNLTYRLNAEMTGTFAKLKDDFNAALAQLEDAMKAVLSGTEDIGVGANEISQSAEDLSRRTEQQAASLEETAAALEEITATVKMTAQNAKEATSIVTKAKAAAEEGGGVVKTAITAMGQIEQSSKQITDIIGIIDEIAFQTNLLALNAGVEAARAGDAGKGFAVVASEVRALAQRSSQAAKEIKSLIQASGSHVASGVKYVGETGDSLRRIVEQVMQINALVGEMASAAEQQSTGIEEVNAAVTQMDQVTQQNAAMVEQSTAAARNLAAETAELKDRVSFFSVTSEDSEDAEIVEPAPIQRSVRRAARTKPVARSGPVSRGSAALAVRPEPSEDEWQEF
jgi:methyl-accepting chemotaxis protein